MSIKGGKESQSSSIIQLFGRKNRDYQDHLITFGNRFRALTRIFPRFFSVALWELYFSQLFSAIKLHGEKDIIWLNGMRIQNRRYHEKLFCFIYVLHLYAFFVSSLSVHFYSFFSWELHVGFIFTSLISTIAAYRNLSFYITKLDISLQNGDLSGLLLLYSSLGDAEGIEKLASLTGKSCLLKTACYYLILFVCMQINPKAAEYTVFNFLWIAWSSIFMFFHRNICTLIVRKFVVLLPCIGDVSSFIHPISIRYIITFKCFTYDFNFMYLQYQSGTQYANGFAVEDIER
ncbi:hypothetical protein ACJX0J_034151 [Zea mays]